MRKTSYFFIIIFLIIGIAQAVPYLPDAPPLPYLHEVSLKTYVSKDDQGSYVYNYMIINGKNNIGDLTGFEIDIGQPEGGMNLSSSGLFNSLKHVVGFGVLGLPDTKPMVPVGFPLVPEGWLAGIGMQGIAGWSICCDSMPDIAPGTLAKGFPLQSWGIPTIRSFCAKPRFTIELSKYYPDIETLTEEDVRKVEEQRQKDEEAIAFKGKTLGPTAPPSDFKPLEFIDYIIGMKHEAFSLGWIRNEGIERSLDSKLDGAKKKLESGNTKAAVNILNAFVKEVEAQGCPTYEDCPDGKHLTSEAYALMKYNAEYLIGRLKD